MIIFIGSGAVDTRGLDDFPRSRFFLCVFNPFVKKGVTYVLSLSCSNGLKEQHAPRESQVDDMLSSNRCSNTAVLFSDLFGNHFIGQSVVSIDSTFLS
jgi:hypothetical protein